MMSTEPVARMIFVKATRSEPVSFEQAKPAITQFLQNDARRKVIESNVQALRTAGKIEYKGKFAERAAAQPKLGTTQGVEVAPAAAVAAEAQVKLPSAASAAGVSISLPAPSAASAVTVDLSHAPAGSPVSLPAAGPGAKVSLPEGGGNTAQPQAVKKAP
jgi:hypothetical protein